MKRLFLILLLLSARNLYAQGRTTVDGNNPQLPPTLGPNGGVKVECIAGTCSGSGGTSVTDNGSITAGQTAGLGASLTYIYNGTTWARVSFGQATMANSIPVTLASNQSALAVGATQTTSPWVDNITQIGGSTLTIGQQLAAASIPVILPAATITTLTPPTTITANQGTPTNWAFNLVQFGGSAVTIGQQLASASLPVILPAATVTTLTPPTTITANQGGAPWSDNITQFGGVNISTGVGAAGTGIPRVTSSRDNVEATGTVAGTGSYTVNLAGTSGVGFVITTACTCTFVYEYSWDDGVTYAAAIPIIAGVQVLSATSVNPSGFLDGNVIVGEHWTNFRVRVSAYTSGSPVVWVHATSLISPLAQNLSAGLAGVQSPLWVNTIGYKSQSALPSAGTAGTNVNAYADPYGVALSRLDHPNRFTCNLTTSATVSTAFSSGCTAPGAGLSLYITDVSIYGGVATSATAAATLQTGAGTTCTTPVVLYYCQHNATAGCEHSFIVPFKVTANQAVCFLDATTGTKFTSVNGFIAP